MEYLVTMTTRVPDGTTEAAVDEVRAREAAHSRELAAQGHLLRLWRPPLQPGEWRTLGLFAAGDASELEQVLASMPLRIWRTDGVMALAPHPNDPGLPQAAAGPGQAEFLTTFTRAVPPRHAGRGGQGRRGGRGAAGGRAGPEGHLLRLWRVPSHDNALGQWLAADPAEMQALLKSLPLDPYLTVDTTPLTPHPTDPAAAAS